MKVNHKFTVLPFVPDLRQRILDILAQGPIEGPDLLARVSKELPMTKQGLYKALRELLRDEIILKEGRLFSFSKTWLTRLNDFKEKSEQNLGLRLPFPETMAKGRKVIHFNSAEALDIYWSHMFLTLSEQYPGKSLFFFNHHSFYSLERPDAERYLIETISKKKYKLMVTFGKRTAINQQFKKEVERESIQIAIDENIIVPKTDHLSIFGDYFITTRYDAVMMERINKLFSRAVSYQSIDKKELHSILSAARGLKIIISKDARKAEIWKKRLAKNFVIKKSEI